MVCHLCFRSLPSCNQGFSSCSLLILLEWKYAGCCGECGKLTDELFVDNIGVANGLSRLSTFSEEYLEWNDFPLDGGALLFGVNNGEISSLSLFPASPAGLFIVGGWRDDMFRECTD